MARRCLACYTWSNRPTDKMAAVHTSLLIGQSTSGSYISESENRGTRRRIQSQDINITLYPQLFVTYSWAFHSLVLRTNNKNLCTVGYPQHLLSSCYWHCLHSMWTTCTYRYRLKAKNQHISIGWKMNTIKKKIKTNAKVVVLWNNWLFKMDLLLRKHCNFDHVHEICISQDPVVTFSWVETGEQDQHHLWPGSRDPFLRFLAQAISLEQMKLDTSNLVCRLNVKSTGIADVKSSAVWGCIQGHVTY